MPKSESRIAVLGAPVLQLRRSVMRDLSFGKFDRLVALIATVQALLPRSSARAEDRPVRILYFTHAAGYRHEVSPVAREIMKQIGEISSRFEVAATEDVSVFTAEN